MKKNHLPKSYLLIKEKEKSVGTLHSKQIWTMGGENLSALLENSRADSGAKVELLTMTTHYPDDTINLTCLGATACSNTKTIHSNRYDRQLSFIIHVLKSAIWIICVGKGNGHFCWIFIYFQTYIVKNVLTSGFVFDRLPHIR